MLSDFRHYKSFPEDYVANLVITPFPDRALGKDLIPELDISPISLEKDIEIESSKGGYIEHPSRKKFLPRSFHKESYSNSSINRTRSRQVFKPMRMKEKELIKRYPRQNPKQFEEICDSLRKDRLILEVWIIKSSRFDIYYWLCQRRELREITLRT